MHHLRTHLLWGLALAEGILLSLVIAIPFLISGVGLLGQASSPRFFAELLEMIFGPERDAFLPFFCLWLFLAVAAAAVIIALLLLWVDRKVTRPLSELTAATEKICDGAYDVEIIGSDEKDIDELCRSLDAMRLKLKARSNREKAILNDRHLLLANISHDMRTPVTTILGYIGAIEDGVAATPEQIGNCHRHIRAKAEFLDYLAAELTEYSDLESGRLRYSFEDVELRAFLADMAAEYQAETEAKGFRFALSLPDGEVVLRADRRRLQRVLQNLLSNAMKYNKPGGSIEVALETAAPYAYICVSDSGIGIPDTSLEKVFDSFYREDASRNSVSGHGLGLAIARQIVSAHRGKIWLQSEEGEGTRAFLALPLKQT